jgi:hypothetical protein
MKKRLASIVITMMLALSTPAQAEDNPIKGLIFLNNLIKALENVDVKYEIERTIIHNLELYKQQKLNEKRLEQGGKKV